MTRAEDIGFDAVDLYEAAKAYCAAVDQYNKTLRLPDLVAANQAANYLLNGTEAEEE